TTVLFFYWSADRRDRHSFPTRRSSDLPWSIAREEEERDLARQGVLVVGTTAPGRGSVVKASARSAFGRRLSEAFGGVPMAERERSEEHTSELQSRENLVCRLLLEKKKT